jgi:hypothetical protein
MKKVERERKERVERLREERPVCRCLRRAVLWDGEGTPFCAVCANAAILMPRKNYADADERGRA